MPSAPPGSGLAPGSKYLGTSYPDPMYYQQQYQMFGNSLLAASNVIQQQQAQQAQQDQAQMRLFLQAAAEDPSAASGMADALGPIAARNPGFATIIAATKNKGRLADLMTTSMDDFQRRADSKVRDVGASLAAANALPDTLPPPMITDPATGQTTPAPSVVEGPGGIPMMGPPQGPQPNQHKQALLQQLQGYLGVGGEPTATPAIIGDVLSEMGTKPAMAAYTGIKHLMGIDLGQEAGVTAFGGQMQNAKTDWMKDLPDHLRGAAMAFGLKSPRDFQRAASDPGHPLAHLVAQSTGQELSPAEKVKMQERATERADIQSGEQQRFEAGHKQSAEQFAATQKRLAAEHGAEMGLRRQEFEERKKEAEGTPLKEMAKQADTEYNQWMKDRSATVGRTSSPRLQAKAEADYERQNPRPFNGADTRRMESVVTKLSGKGNVDPDTLRLGIRARYQRYRDAGQSHDAALSKATSDYLSGAKQQ